MENFNNISSSVAEMTDFCKDIFMKEKSIVKLVNYAVSCSLIDAEDRVWAANLLLDAIGETAFDTELDWSIDGELDSALEELTDLAAANGILDGESVTQRDLFDTKLMGILTPRPSDVIRRFRANFEVSPQKATDEYYNLSRNTNYISCTIVNFVIGNFRADAI